MAAIFGCQYRLLTDRIEHLLASIVSGELTLPLCQEPGNMAAFEDLATVVRNTETMKTLLRGLEEESAKLLGAICKEYEQTGRTVPDHHLHITGYGSDILLRALVSAELVTKERGDRYFIYGYRPTTAGLNHCRAMLEEKAI